MMLKNSTQKKTNKKLVLSQRIEKEIANVMVAKDIHRTVVLSPVGRKPVGLLSATDIVKNITEH